MKSFLLLLLIMMLLYQPRNTSKTLVLYSALLHVSAVYISHHQLDIKSQKEYKGERPPLTNINIHLQATFATALACTGC